MNNQELDDLTDDLHFMKSAIDDDMFCSSEASSNLLSTAINAIEELRDRLMTQSQ